MMCDFKQLYADRSGYIIQCLNCNQFQVCFGTSLLTLNLYQYKNFFQAVLVKMQELPLLELDTCFKCHVLPTASPNVQCILTGEELYWLYDAMEIADIEIRTAELLNLFRENE